MALPALNAWIQPMLGTVEIRGCSLYDTGLPARGATEQSPVRGWSVLCQSMTITCVSGKSFCSALSHSVVSNSFGTTWTVANQAPLSMGFSRQEYWSKLPFLLPGHHPHPRLLHLLHWQLDFLPLYHRGSPKRKFTLRNTGRSRQTARVFLIKYIDKLHAEWRDMFTHTHTQNKPALKILQTKRKGLSLKHLPWVPNGQGVPSEGTRDSGHEVNLGTLSGPCKRSQGHMVAFWFPSRTWGDKTEVNLKGELCSPERHSDCKASLWSNCKGSHLLSTPST